jgi:hypothetical protein
MTDLLAELKTVKPMPRPGANEVVAGKVAQITAMEARLGRVLTVEEWQEFSPSSGRLVQRKEVCLVEPKRSVEKLSPKRVLRLETDGGLAEAYWEKIHGIWSCTRASWVLRWMVGMNVDQAKLALLRMGGKWKWEDFGDSVNNKPQEKS